MVSYGKVQSDQGVVRPVKQSGGRTVVLHKEVPFPFVSGDASLDQLKGAALKFLADLIFI